MWRQCVQLWTIGNALYYGHLSFLRWSHLFFIVEENSISVKLWLPNFHRQEGLSTLEAEIPQQINEQMFGCIAKWDGVSNLEVFIHMGALKIKTTVQIVQQSIFLKGIVYHFESFFTRVRRLIFTSITDCIWKCSCKKLSTLLLLS